jgi:peptide deformylase
MIELIKLHYKKSKPVKSYKEIEADAEEMKKLIDGGFSGGNYSVAFALSHCEVNNDPFDFFVVSQKLVDDKVFKDRVIINPKITGKDEKMLISMTEACMSVPFRRPKKVKRYFKVNVEYQIANGDKLKTKKEEAEGLKSQIFQHQIDHNESKNIYFKK